MWNLKDEVGAEKLEVLVHEFYQRVMDDLMIGFLFNKIDIEEQSQKLIHYMSTHIGTPTEKYRGMSVRQGHEAIPILPGHFDRRHQILKDILEVHLVPAHVRKAWLDLDLALRNNVLKRGAQVREDLLASG